MNTPIALTAISGGINRLRTKGGADKNSLFDLLNGYVTQAGTAKVREGTNRNANIATYSGAGMTKGLLAYQSKFHVFSHQVVGVPPGYELHVINHPAAVDTVVTPVPVNTRTGTFAAATKIGTAAGFGAVSATTQNGFAIEAVITPDPGGAVGFALPVSVGGFTIASFFQATGTSVNDPNQVYLIFTGAFNLVGATMTYNVGGVPQVFALDILHQTTQLGLGSGYTVFKLGTATPDGHSGGGWNVPFTFGLPTISTVVVPIKEIHFAAPYLGGIYVAASFVITNPTILAQFGDTYHFWIQSSAGGDNSNAWQASTDYSIGDVVIPTTANGLTYIASRRYPPNPLWQASTLEAVNNIVEPTTPNNFQYTATAVLGANPSTGTTEPTWPTADGAVVKENSSLANDQTITRVQPATNTPTSAPPSRYGGGIAGGFSVGIGG